ncbi:MAG: hypothetical protein V7L21_09025 [Nostoc sp.]|uniref:hypothetical protein n=1 Tax=Nostoc sp. TaxID=1180 RepID=UPI002FF86013
MEDAFCASSRFPLATQLSCHWCNGVSRLLEAMSTMVTERLVSGVEPCRTTSLRDATRTWKQASKSVCLRHAART